MKSLILAAGYATRLYPLTKDFPKPLLNVGKTTILDRILADLDEIEQIDELIIVTNDTFFSVFENWKLKTSYKKTLTLINDGTVSNETRLGAVKDILFVIDKLNIKDDLLVLAGDNVVDFSFKDFVDFSLQKMTSCITFHQENSIEALQKTGVLEADENFKVIEMHEKPLLPPSNFAVPPFYYYQSKDIPLISKAIENGCGYDAPGNLISWLCKETEVHAWQIPGSRFDIGDLESYESVCKLLF